MKGIIFRLLESVILKEYGECAWDELLRETGLDGAYASVGDYPDAHLDKLVSAAAAAREISEVEMLRWFGRAALPMLAERNAEFFRGHSSVRSFLLTLNDVIHPEVKKLYPDASPPAFQYRIPPTAGLTMEYVSTRKLCAFAEGMIEGAAAYYGESVRIEQPTCQLRGGDRCVLDLSFERLEDASKS